MCVCVRCEVFRTHRSHKSDHGRGGSDKVWRSASEWLESSGDDVISVMTDATSLPGRLRTVVWWCAHFFASRTTHDTTMPPTRRGTLGLGSTPKLERRLHLRGIFDALDHDADAGVSIAELQEGLARHAEVGVLRDDDHSVAHEKRLGV